MPAMKPSLLLDFANSRQLSPRVTFTRASTAWRFNRRGLLVPAASNEPRFDHDPVTLACRGLLIEEARTNLLLHNRDLTQAAWVKTNITATRDQVGIDGAANTATRIAATAANATVLQSITSGLATRATTGYVRRVLGSGVVEMTQDNGVTWVPVTVTSAWTRVGPASAAVTNPVVGFRLVASGDEIAVDYLQCESGALFATSPIETAGAQVTRALEACLIDGAAFSSFWRQDAFTVAVAFTRNSTNSAVAQALWAVSDGTANNRVSLVVEATPNSRLLTLRNSGGAGLLFSPALVGSAPFGRSLAAMRVQPADVAMSFNGQAPITVSSHTMVTTMSQLEIGRQLSGSHFNGHIERLTVYPAGLSNADLQAIATP